MAFIFNGSTSNALKNSAPATGVPLTFSGWFNPDVLTGTRAILSINDDSAAHATGEFFDIHVNSSGNIVARTRSGATTANATTSTTASTGTWQHACGVFDAVNSRAAFLDGAGKGTDSTSVTPTGLDVTAVGATRGSGVFDEFDGSLAEMAIYDAALTDAEVALLAQGVWPLFIRPENLIFYIPIYGLFTGDADLVGPATGSNLVTFFNVTAANDHPPIFRSGFASNAFLAEAAPVTADPLLGLLAQMGVGK